MENQLNLKYLLGQAVPGDPGGGIMSTVIMFALIILIFYFMILRPQQKRQKERQKLLEGVKKGDKIITVGGLHGTVVGVEEKILLVQVADNLKLKIERSGVSSINREGSSEVITN